jgi:hypothetical protein
MITAYIVRNGLGTMRDAAAAERLEALIPRCSRRDSEPPLVDSVSSTK